MTELECTLKNALLMLERDLTTTLETHAAQLNGQQSRLEAQGQNIQELRRNIQQMQTEQQESARHLQRLSAIHANLEPLLLRLSALLSTK